MPQHACGAVVQTHLAAEPEPLLLGEFIVRLLHRLHVALDVCTPTPAAVAVLQIRHVRGGGEEQRGAWDSA